MTTRPRYQTVPFSEGYYDAGAERQANVIGRKIAQARQAKGLSLPAFSELLGRHGLAIKRQGIGKWETGVAVPNAYQLLAICHALEIEEGLGYFTHSPTPEPELNEAGMKKLRDYKEDLIASGRYTPRTGGQTDIIYLEMPVSTLPASAGTGAFLEEENFELLQVPASTVPAGADFGVRVSGESMEPVYHDGQLVWIQRCSQLSPGEVGLFLYDGDGYIKVYELQEPEADASEQFTDSNGILHPQPVLISYNPAYEPKRISPELTFQIAGRVLR